MSQKLNGAWSGWTLTDRSLISPTGREFTPDDVEGMYSQSDLARALGVTRGAVADRMRRGTLPPYDDPDKKMWRFSTIQHLIPR